MDRFLFIEKQNNILIPVSTITSLLPQESHLNQEPPIGENYNKPSPVTKRGFSNVMTILSHMLSTGPAS